MLLSRLVGTLTTSTSWESISENDYFVRICDLSRYNPLSRKETEHWLQTQLGSFPLELLHLLHFHGAIHYKEIFFNLKLSDSSVQSLEQRLKEAGKIALDSIVSYCLSHIDDPSYSSCKTLLHTSIEAIASDNTASNRLLSPILDHFAQASKSHPCLSLLFQSLSQSQNGSTKSWDIRISDQQSAIDKLCDSFPSTFLLGELLRVSRLETTSPSFMLSLSSKLDQDKLWETITEMFRQTAATAPPLESALLLTLAFHLDKVRYYAMIINSGIDDICDAKTLSEILLAVLDPLPGFIATEHINKIRTTANSSKSWFRDFQPAVMSMLQRRDVVPTALLPAPIASSSDTAQHVSKWISIFESTGKLPLKELGVLKMFKPGELSAALDLLLDTTLNVEEKTSVVMLVLELGRLKWVGGRKFEHWEEARFALQRAKLLSNQPSTSGVIAPRDSTISDLRGALDRWTKNVACGATDAIAYGVSSLLKSDAENANAVHDLLWSMLLEVVDANGGNRGLEIDRFISRTFVAHSTLLYPLLSVALLSQLDSKTPSYGAIASMIVVLASHDRLQEFTLLDLLWHPTTGILRFSPKNGLASKLTLVISVLKATVTRFKAVALRNNAPTTTTDTLESAQARIGLIDHKLASFIIWIAKKTELCSTTNAGRKHRFALLNKELSEIMRHHLLKPMFDNHTITSLDQLIDMEVGFESFEFSDLATFKYFLPIIQRHFTTDSSKIMGMEQMCFRCESVDMQKSPILRRFLKTTIISSSKTFYSNLTPQNEESTSRRSQLDQRLQDTGSENMEPNTKLKPTKSVAFRASSASHPALVAVSFSTQQHLQHYSALTLSASSDTSESSTQSSCWLLDPLEACLSHIHEDQSLKLQFWLEMANEADERWLVVENRSPRLIALSSVRRLCMACDRLSQSSSPSSSIALLKLASKGLEELRKTSSENDGLFELSMDLIQRQSLTISSLLEEHVPKSSSICVDSV